MCQEHFDADSSIQSKQVIKKEKKPASLSKHILITDKSIYSKSFHAVFLFFKKK